MKRYIAIFLALIVKYSAAQAPDPDFTDKMAFSEAQSHQKMAAFSESGDYASYDLVYQRLNLNVDPAVNFISGSVLSQMKFLKENVNQIQFDLNSALIVDSVTFDWKKAEFQQNADKITIFLPAGIQVTSFHLDQIFYHGVPPQNGFGSFVASKHNNVPIIWTLSEPYGAHDWWPCKESLSDKIDSIDVFITCPSQYKAASNGRLVADIVTGSQRTAHWKHHYPIATYLVAIAVTNYETYSDFLNLSDGHKIEILNYIYPEYLATAKTKTADILNIMSFYNSRLITYPFAAEKYGHAQFGWGGGMEHQTMSFMESLDFELVAHEMAHQWFGDYITLASWHDIWLNEGFATYMVGLVYENLLGGYFWPIWKNQQVNKITASASGSVYVADTTSVSRIFNGRLSYSKGAYLLQMLRWEMGDSHFFKGLKDYLTDPSVAGGFATTEKFEKHMEAAADTSFTEFFKDWYYGEGSPVFRIVYFPDPENPGKQKLRINQTSSHPSVSFFEMHLPVRVWNNGISKDFRLYNTRQNQEFVIPETKIDSIQFDPDKWLCAIADKVLAASEISGPGQIQIIPEYAAKQIRIVLPEGSGKETFRIFDLTGRTFLSGWLPAKDSKVDIGTLKNGIYLVEVETTNKKKVQKIMVN